MPKKIITVTLTERHQEMLKEIGDKIGLERDQAVIQISIFEYHKELFKPYLTYKSSKNPEDKAIQDLEKAEHMRLAKEKKKFEEKKEIADELEGEIFEDGGIKYCKWTTYEYMNPSYVHEGQMTMPLDDLSVTDLETKWVGGKEKILEVLTKQKNNE